MGKELPVREMIEKALGMRMFSYVPYSGYRVGAALLGEDGVIYTGCNVENAAYSPGNCAERTAFFKAVSEGQRAFRAICIVGGSEDARAKQLAEYAPPCGMCRQVMMEFCQPDEFQIILARSVEEYEIYTLEELFPMGFGPGNLMQK
ncbi:MAG: cytidine deaminase [Lachnospiraceae bacterium]|nr:cytidine deaminase [Lachnospiraceae bacterium]